MTPEQLGELSDKAARMITEGAGLKALAQLLAEAVQGAVLIEDAQWQHLAFAECRPGIGRVPPSFESYFGGDGNSKSADSLPKQIRLSDTLSAFCAAMPGRPGEGGACGHVTLFVRQRTSQTGIALRIVAGLAGIEYARRSSGRAQQRDQFWERFLGGSFPDDEALRQEAAAAAVSLPAAFIAAAVDVEGEPVEVARDALLTALGAAQAASPPSAGVAYLPLLFPVRNQADAARVRQAMGNALHELAQMQSARTLTCGIGNHHADLLHTRLSLKEAVDALKLGRRLFGRGSVTVYADLGLYAVLYAASERHSFRRFADSYIERLAGHDRRHKTELLKTLTLYFEVGENIKEAAERLCVHRHTIFYRLNQISQILTVDLKSPKDQLSLRAALAIRQIYADEVLHE